jgi:hypothetical protein
MYLTYRDSRVEDVPQALPYIQARLAHLAGSERGLLELLTHLVGTKRAPSVVVEDQDRPAGQRVVGFSLGFFADEEFYAFLHDKARGPYLAKHAVDWWTRGQAPDVDETSYALEQAKGGGDLVFLVKGVDQAGFKGPDLNLLREHASLAFVKRIFTYRIRSFSDEVYGQDELARLKSFGMELYHDFGGAMDPALQPYFVGIDMQKLRHDPSQTPSVAKRYALLPQPRFGFTPREQEILRLAMVGATDREIASELGLTLIAIKKRWEAIYGRVPEFDKVEEDEEGEQPKQRRRTLVQLLADHPEELWLNKKTRD